MKIKSIQDSFNSIHCKNLANINFCLQEHNNYYFFFKDRSSDKFSKFGQGRGQKTILGDAQFSISLEKLFLMIFKSFLEASLGL